MTREPPTDSEIPTLGTEEGGRPAVPFIDMTRPLVESQALWMTYFEREYLRRLLRSVDYDFDRAARIAGISRHDFDALIYMLEVEPGPQGT